MIKLNEAIESIGHESQITLEDIPSIDLYMDQVIQLFETKFADVKRTPDEKVLTKTMINNYAKGKLLFPIKNKKYSKDHLILISLIYQLKGALSISDIKKTLNGMNEKVSHDNLRLDDFYSSYLQMVSENAVNFIDSIKLQEQNIQKEMGKFESSEDASTFEPVLMIASLVHMSNLYRRVAEKLVDELIERQTGKPHK